MSAITLLKKELINPKGTEGIYQSMKFSQAVKAGNFVFVSGQVGVDVTFKAAEGIENQTRLAFQNLKRVLEKSGATLGDIVELVTYHRSMKELKGFAKVKNEFIAEDFPAWTAVGVTELVMPELLVEIRATALIGSALR